MRIEASLVPETAKRDASAPGRCVQQKIALASIWTDAMLAALKSGVKGGKWHCTNNGRMLTSLILGCSRCTSPIARRANPDAETTDWRARRWRTGRRPRATHRVRREETASAVSYPYPTARRRHSTCRREADAWRSRGDGGVRGHQRRTGPRTVRAGRANIPVF